MIPTEGQFMYDYAAEDFYSQPLPYYDEDGAYGDEDYDEEDLD